MDESTSGVTKRCNLCGEVKPGTEFYKNSGTRDRLGSCCKLCSIAKAAAWRKANPERAREHARNGYWRGDIEAKRARGRAYYAANAEERRAKGRAWAAANPDYFKKWRAEHADEMKAHYAAKRARRKMAPVGEVDLAKLWTGSCEICGQELSLDLKFPDPMSKSIDHIVPLARGGGHVQDNLQWAHLICNMRKSDKLPGEKAPRPRR